VLSFSSPVARKDGHITPPAAVYGTALADAGAAVDGSGEVTAIRAVRQRERATYRSRGRNTQVRVEETGPDDDTGVENVVRVDERNAATSARWPGVDGVSNTRGGRGRRSSRSMTIRTASVGTSRFTKRSAETLMRWRGQ
jgi:hypothetical protein